MDNNSLEILKVLTETPGVSGFESPIRRELTGYLSPLASQVKTDHLGSLIALKEGNGSGPRVMLAAHMDEVGFMVTHITEEGFLKFQDLGGWWEQVLLGQRVEVLTAGGPVMGVFGAKAPHILTPEERKDPVKKKAMFVDVGSTSRGETEGMGVRPGDPMVPWSPFTMNKGSRTIMAKALDDRAGCAVVVELFQQLHQEDHPNSLYGVMTVQEEVGLRGAATSVDVVRPDVAIVVDVAVATDTPGIGEGDVPTKTYLGKGPVIGFYDASMIPHRPLRDLVVKTAADNGIPYQVEVMAGGGTDAGKIHVYRQGVPSVVVGIPVRYIHGHVGVAHLDDYHQAVRLLLALVKALDSDMVKQLTNDF